MTDEKGFTPPGVEQSGEIKESPVEQYLGDGIALAQRIQDSGFAAVEQAVAEIGNINPKLIYHSDHSEATMVTEGMIAGILKLRRGNNRPYTELVAALIGVFAQADDKNKDFHGWSHSLCHLFEGYVQKPSRPSFFESPHDGSTIEKMVNETLKRGMEINDIGCGLRILKPLICYNLDQIDPTKLDTFPLKPAHDLSYWIRTTRLLSRETEGSCVDFCLAKSPREFITALINDKLPIEASSLSKIFALLQAMKDKIPADEMTAYLNQVYPVNNQPIDLEAALANIETSAEATEFLRGVYVDVEGTIIINGKISEDALRNINYGVTAGKEIIIFTGGNANAMTEQLRSMGFPEQFLPVRSKHDFRGKVLEELIDDTPPELQGFKTKEYTKPEYWK